MEQLVARLVHIQEVVGSNPTPATIDEETREANGNQ